MGGMEAAALREMQAPLKQKYRDDPETARTPMHGRADFSSAGITCTVQTWAGPVRAGLHPATGGGGEDACSGDMLLPALVGCARVTPRRVGPAVGVPDPPAALSAPAGGHLRGTPRVSP